jgi:hypothetical protein
MKEVQAAAHCVTEAAENASSSVQCRAGAKRQIIGLQ